MQQRAGGLRAGPAWLGLGLELEGAPSSHASTSVGRLLLFLLLLFLLLLPVADSWALITTCLHGTRHVGQLSCLGLTPRD